MTLPVTRREAELVAVALGRNLVSANTVPSSLFSQPALRAEHCPALDPSSGECLAYDVRPQVCKDFQCDGRDRFAHSAESISKLTLLSGRKDPVADLRDFLPESIEQVFSRHDKIAFQFSGGKDSTAALLSLRNYWDRFTVYFCDSGDSMPETLSVVDQVAAMLPNFVTIPGRVKQTRAQFGNPTDVLPWTSSATAHDLNTGYSPLMQDRVSCCFRSVMLPVHERMVADGITLIIRGQKNCDTHKGALRNGSIAGGFEFFYPIQNWTDEQCFSFMREQGVEPQKFYFEGLTHSGDCASCTAWCEDNRGAYLKNHHPVVFEEYRKNMAALAGVLHPMINNIVKELDACEV